MKMKIVLVLAACLALAGSASAVEWRFMGTNDNLWHTSGNWEENSSGAYLPTLAIPTSYEHGITTDVDCTIAQDVYNDIDPNDPLAIGSNLKGPGYGPDPTDPNGSPAVATLTILDAVTVEFEGWRVGNSGASGITNIGANCVVNVSWYVDLPRRSTSTITSAVMNLGPGSLLQAGALNVTTAAGQINMDPTAVIRVVGGAQAGAANDPTPFIASGQIIGTGGETPLVRAIPGYDGTPDAGFEVYIPEPATLSLLALGGLAALRRRR